MFWNTQCHEFRRLQKWWIALKICVKQLPVFEKNQNFPVYITIASLTSLIVALKKPLYDCTMKTFLYITKTCNMHESQKCRINTINSKTLKKLLKIIQIWGSLLSRQSFGNRTQETNIKKKQVINAMSKGGTLFSPIN